MSNIHYYRVSSRDQSIEAQRHHLGSTADRAFHDEAVSGAVVAAKRPGFAAMIDYMREGDTVYVTAIDRLGRDSIDVQTTYRDYFKARGIKLYVSGLGIIEGQMGEFFVAMLAQVAQMEKDRIRERCQMGREAARASLAQNGVTHRGKASLGRTPTVDPKTVRAWREANGASIQKTADQFKVSTSTVKRACR